GKSGIRNFLTQSLLHLRIFCSLILILFGRTGLPSYKLIRQVQIRVRPFLLAATHPRVRLLFHPSSPGSTLELPFPLTTGRLSVFYRMISSSPLTAFSAPHLTIRA